MKLHQRQLPDPFRHCSIALNVVLIPHSLELFLVPFASVVFGSSGHDRNFVAVLELANVRRNHRRRPDRPRG